MQEGSAGRGDGPESFGRYFEFRRKRTLGPPAIRRSSCHHTTANRLRGNRQSSQKAIAMFRRFQPKPLRKAARYESVASKIAPDIQPPTAMPARVEESTNPTRVPASSGG